MDTDPIASVLAAEPAFGLPHLVFLLGGVVALVVFFHSSARAGNWRACLMVPTALVTLRLTALGWAVPAVLSCVVLVALTSTQTSWFRGNRRTRTDVPAAEAPRPV
jgi:hypothetical protein